MKEPYPGMPLPELLEVRRELRRLDPVRYFLYEVREFLFHPVTSIRAWRKLRELRPLLLEVDDGSHGQGTESP